ncbi:hypothetical protein H7J06_18420 [Mycobacterium hodleri]|uniref:hypothetical protein n=1 Tax=Mycolicibacterium hodleri TaxID=49897 RepID=UPI0021F27542|nr:hypothetical protein [Mycolicibacterium hodleri]MCV7134958.1 hypothetical protein [Mycolicibacterium hodleri]
MTRSRLSFQVSSGTTASRSWGVATPSVANSASTSTAPTNRAIAAYSARLNNSCATSPTLAAGIARTTSCARTGSNAIARSPR